MASFNREAFLRKHGVNPVLPVEDSQGYRSRLKAWPDSWTPADLQKAIKETKETLKVSLPETLTEAIGGKRPSIELPSRRAAEFWGNAFADETPEETPTNRLTGSASGNGTK